VSSTAVGFPEPKTRATTWIVHVPVAAFLALKVVGLAVSDQPST